MTIAELKAKIEALEKEKKELEKAITLFQAEGKAWETKAKLDLIKKTIEKYFLHLMQEIPNANICVGGFNLVWKKLSAPKTKNSGLTIIKNQESVEIKGKESWVAKAQRLSKQFPEIPVSKSSLIYSKTAKKWIMDNFPITTDK